MKFLLMPIVGLVLAGCASKDIVRNPDNILYQGHVLAPTGAAKAVESADWSKAEKVHLTLNEDGFEPMFVDLEVGKPYVLVFEKEGKLARSVVGDDFFASLAVKSLSGSEEATPNAHVEAIDLGSKEARVLHAIPLEKGRFTISDGRNGIVLAGWHFNLLNFFRTYPGGIITVQ